MKKLVLLCLVLLCSISAFSQVRKKPFKYWEELSEKDKKATLSDSSSYPGLIDLYHGKYDFSNSEKNLILFKILSADNEKDLAFRFFLFNKLITANDTILNKLLNTYSTKFIFNHPDVVINYFTKERLKKNDPAKPYIAHLAYDMDERIEYQNFTYFLSYYFENASADTKQTLRLMFKELGNAGAGKKDPGK